MIIKYLNILNSNILKFRISVKTICILLLFFIPFVNNVSFGFNDTEKKLFIESAWDKVYNDPQFVIKQCYNYLNDKANKQDSSTNAEINRILGTAYLITSEYQKSIDYFTLSIEFYYSKNFKINVANLYNDIGICYLELGKTEEAKKFLLMALDIFNINKLQNEISTVKSNIGRSFFYSYDYVNAVKYYLQALKIADKQKNKESLVIIVNNIAVIYNTLKNTDNALKYYNKALQIYEKSDNSHAKSVLLNNIGNIYFRQDKLDVAEKYYLESLEIKKKINNKVGISNTLTNIGEIYEKKEDFVKALDYYTQSNKLMDEIKSTSGFIYTNDCIARLYYKQKDLKKAELFFLRSVELGKIAKVPTKTAHHFLAEIYKERKEYEKSLFHLRNMAEIEDTVFGPDKVNEINKLLADYENIKKDEEITSLSEKNKFQEQQIRERTIFIVILVLLACVLIVLFISIFRYSKKVERSKEELKLSHDKLSEALKDLQAEIENRKKIEKDLLITQDKLATSLEKVKEYSELKTRFISMISHEYRNPLTVIMNATELLPIFNKLKNPEQHDKYLLMIRQQVDVMVKLLNDVLIIGKTGSTELKPNPMSMPLVDICKDVITNTKFIDENRHNITLNSPSNIGLITTDIQFLNHILSNLLLNATKYSPWGTDIDIELTSKDDIFKIIIKDRGIGIPEADKTHVFEPFHRGSNIGSIAGNGLGLGIAKMFLDLLGGTIEFESQENLGTTFTITIPKEYK